MLFEMKIFDWLISWNLRDLIEHTKFWLSFDLSIRQIKRRLICKNLFDNYCNGFGLSGDYIGLFNIYSLACFIMRNQMFSKYLII